MQDNFFPYRSPEPVGEIVHFVHHHEAESNQVVAVCINHVSQNLSRHDNNLGIGVLIGVTGQQPHSLGAISGHQLEILLVA